MSNKHKKHKNSPNNNPNYNKVNESVNEITDIIENDIEEVEEDVEESENIEVIENLTVDNNVSEENDIHDNVTETANVIVEPEVVVKVAQPIKPVSVYRIGTGLLNDKHVSATDFSIAKEICDSSRNNFKKSYYVFNNNGDVIYTSEYSSPKDNFYRVGTEWRNGVCINQKIMTTKLYQV